MGDSRMRIGLCLLLALTALLGLAGCSVAPRDSSGPERSLGVATATVDPVRASADLTLDQQRRRDDAHAQLRSGNYHDSSLALVECGDVTSVPLLIQALHSALPVDGAVECTYGHVLDALQAITHQDIGIDYDKWAAWWAAHETQSR